MSRANVEVEIRRSLAVTEQLILERFSLARVLTQLAEQSEVPGVTALSLFNQWWDTQNPASSAGAAPHCNDSADETLGSVLNGYPYYCRPAPSEGFQSSCDPFAPESACAYAAIALFNRFDLAPEDGSHCGEYRIVYGKRSGMTTSNDRNLLIFEATMMNPVPEQGLRGCRKLVDVWGRLSGVDELEARADVLEEFYFDGQGNVPPVISIAHFGDNALGAGQVRTNQFVQTTTGWSLREYKLLRRCTAGSCTAVHFVPQTNKNNPYGYLFDPTVNSANSAAFLDFFPGQVASLAGTTLAEIDVAVPDKFNSGQSQASGSTAAEMRYLERVGYEPSVMRTSIAAELTRLGSELTVEDIVLRAQAMSCAGCHRLNNDEYIGGGLTWPSALGFVHVSERDTESVDGVTRHRISDALLNSFLPHRKQVLEDFLNNRPRPAKAPKHPIGGRRSHG